MYKQTRTQRLKQRRLRYQHITADDNKQKEKKRQRKGQIWSWWV